MFRPRLVWQDLRIGYGQLFLCANPRSGLLFMLAMCLLSPRSFLLGLAGALAVVLMSHMLPVENLIRRSGLFGVNGVLLGSYWVLLPEVEFHVALLLTLGAALPVALLLQLYYRDTHRRAKRIPLFSLPAVVLFWTLVLGSRILGLSDAGLSQAWKSYHAEDWTTAALQFEQIPANSSRLLAAKETGSGWTAFRQGRYRQADGHFKSVIRLDAGNPGALDGLGWSRLLQGNRSGAAEAFNQALARAPWQGTSWDGLGWCELGNGDSLSAFRAFRRAAWLNPLFADPHEGLRRCQLSPGEAGSGMTFWHRQLQKLEKGPLRLLPLADLLAWLLILGGVLLHSRISFLVTLSSLALLALLLQLPGMPGLADINYGYNLLALSIALGGCYLLLNPLTSFLLMLLQLAFLLCWPCWEMLIPADLPILSLPFNLGLVVVLFLVRAFGKQGRDLVVPLTVALLPPEEVLWWRRKRDLLAECRARSQSSPGN